MGAGAELRHHAGLLQDSNASGPLQRTRAALGWRAGARATRSQAAPALSTGPLTQTLKDASIRAGMGTTLQYLGSEIY